MSDGSVLFLGNPMAFIFLIPALILSLSVSNLLYYIQWFILKVVMGMLGYNFDDCALLVLVYTS